MTVSPPVPAFELAERVSPLGDKADPIGFYLDYGRQIADEIAALLPSDWDWTGKRVLDFGCGAGRTLRHLTGRGAELHGCDIDAPSIAWLCRHMSPPVHAFQNDEAPPLDRPDQHFDLVYAVSVFTHITDRWAEWLLELHRVLKPGGLLIATFLGEGAVASTTGEPWHEERFGMNVLNRAQRWDRGGPTVIHSPWWIREHWGRAFEIVELRPHGFAAAPGNGHGVAVMRRRPGRAPGAAELERIDPDEPREVLALRHNIEQLHRESADARHWLEELQRSPSWRVTAPLRAAKRAVRGLRT